MMIRNKQSDRIKGELSQEVLGLVSRRVSSRSASTWLGLSLGLYVSMIWFTRPLSFGDTIFYVRDILAAGQYLRLEALRPLLEFGHLLWRPLGWLLFVAIRTLTPITLGGERMAVTRILIFISMLSGAIATLLLHLICRRLGFGWTVSFLACATFVCCNSVIYAASTGLSYMLALALLTAALWLAIRSRPGKAKPSHWDLWWAGALLALSVATWFPFVLVVPAVAAAAAIRWDEPKTFSAHHLLLTRMAHVMGASVVGGLIIFGGAALVLDIHSIVGIKEWVSASAHGWRQNLNILRLEMGLPRCCVALTDDAGVVWKRFFFRDPFAPVAPRELFQASLGLLILFYFGFLLLLYTLVRSNKGKIFLFLLTIAAIPVLMFAVFLFEPSSIERFMPVLPFYFMALGYQLHLAWPSLKQRSLALIYPVVLILSTLATYHNGSVEQHWAPTLARLQALKQQLPPGSTVSVLANWDDNFLFIKDNPLRDTFSNSLSFWVVLQPSHSGIFCWRQRFASRVLEVWGASSEIWVSERLLASTPLSGWGWVEGDDSAIRWYQVPEFFHQFQFDKKIGDSDGFVRIARTQTNRILLDNLTAQPCKPVVVATQSLRYSPPLAVRSFAAGNAGSSGDNLFDQH